MVEKELDFYSNSCRKQNMITSIKNIAGNAVKYTLVYNW